MKSLDIPVREEPLGQQTGNVPLLLSEIRHALERLLETGENTALDLRSIPLGPGELDKLLDKLGTGEIKAELNALGPSEIVETAYPGVWRVTHYNENREIMGVFIEVCRIPDLLSALDDDMQEGLKRLEDALASSQY